ncbi:DUF7079 family protein [Atopomonas sediminilitoris]|uniref:DUF7079 family protein n=1 Tax=Atopomonas sediminilitoris TaxID=2919919 RepID=UPI001F4E190D|nr:hypothetical protein [Atopomonas sediminilitoris]MCJ8169647.1 hypothetical protein [Atopomonas sediminilitoris]
MDDAFSPDEQIHIWTAFSDAFVDNEVDFHYIAKQVSQYPLPVLEQIFFTEVAPACAGNAFSVIPSIWAAFDPESLAAEIRQNRNQKHTVLSRFTKQIKLKFLRKYFAEEWLEIANAIKAERIRKSP